MPGIHHVTGITANVQANVDFYADLLGLRLVKRTVNHSDSEVLHLFYGDSGANPGSILTFFVWPGGSGGRRGHGQAAELGLAVPRTSIGYWATRLVEHGVRFAGPTVVGDVTTLQLTDPDGLAVVLVGSGAATTSAPWSGSPVPAEHQLRGIDHVTFWTERPRQTGAVLTELLGFRAAAGSGSETTYLADAALGGQVRVRDVKGFWSGADGAGTLQHVAFRAHDDAELSRVMEAVLLRGLELSDQREHGYFRSIYFREPGGSLIEVATDGPGATIDEPAEALGTRLVLPFELEGLREDIEVVMPHFTLPGEPRRPERDLGWVHRFTPGTTDTTLLVLHGSGGSETQLLPLARRVSGGAGLLAPRGRSTAEEELRFFARRADGSFDQDELDHEADALAEFVGDAAAWYGFAADRVVILGYSNGAHIGAAALARHPVTFRAAALLRSVAPVGLKAGADLTGRPVLMLQGEGDHLLRDRADERLAAYLRGAGADLQLTEVPGGHALGAPDEEVLRTWLAKLEP